MIYAEHVIGLSAVDLGHYEYHPGADRDAIAACQRARFEAIKAEGVLRARGKAPLGLDDPGSQADYDILAGDDRYIFLSAGPRYREGRRPDVCYGFVFDAVRLVEQCGALVGPDLLDDYTALLDEVAEEVDAALPPAPEVSDQDLAEFAALLSLADDAAVLAFVRERSTSHFFDIVDGVKARDLSVPGVELALQLWHERLPALLARMRVSGSRALQLLADAGSDGSLELLVEGSLDLSLAVATIEAGDVIPISSDVPH